MSERTSEPALISDPALITADWLTEVLRGSGALPEGKVSDLRYELFGAGMVGDNARFFLTYEGGEGPATLVGKFPTEDEVSRASSVMTRTYEIESRFYQQLAQRVDMATPHAHVALLDVEANEFVLIMDDAAPCRVGDQIDGCGLEDSTVAVLELAALHAPLWGSPELGEMPWLDRWTGDGQSFYAQFIAMLYQGFIERYDERLEPGVREAGDELLARIGEYLAYRPEPLTVVHGDYRLDNLLFDGRVPVTTVDWQTVTRGPALTDVAYFCGTSPVTDVRREHEESLVRQYHAALETRGVSGYGWDQCWHDYRRFAFAGFLMAVGASMVVGRTDRGDDMFLAMANRSARMAIDHDTLSML